MKGDNHDRSNIIPPTQYVTPNVTGYQLGYPAHSPVLQPFRKKSILEAYLLAVLLGFLGAHHFYLRRPGFGILYFFTFGLLGCGYVYDLFRIPCLVKDANKRTGDHPDTIKSKRLDDAYVLWLPPFGLLGFHHFYLRNYGLGALYFCTVGLFGIGWILDCCLMPSHFRRTKYRPENQEKCIWEAYVFALSPIGLFGGQHFYLGRIANGLLYFFTFGLFGMGWIFDWFRVPCLVRRTNQKRLEGDSGRKYLDDAYLLWFPPFGLLGLHHFYLHRFGWGCLYFFSFGLFGIGWLIDFCRMPCLVKEFNKCLEERKTIPTHQTVSVGANGVFNNSPSGASGSIMTPPMAPPQYYQFDATNQGYQAMGNQPVANGAYMNHGYQATNTSNQPPGDGTYILPGYAHVPQNENPPPYTAAYPNIGGEQIPPKS